MKRQLLRVRDVTQCIMINLILPNLQSLKWIIIKFDLDIVMDDEPQTGKTLFRKEVDLQINQNVCMSSEFLNYLLASCI